jgi:hypothetical protein
MKNDLYARNLKDFDLEDVYTTHEVARLLADLRGQIQPLTRSAVSEIAKRHLLRVARRGKPHLYLAEDVNRYIRKVRRTTILVHQQWFTRQSAPGKWYYEDESLDFYCPICRAFAVRNPNNNDEWACANGHSQTQESIK